MQLTADQVENCILACKIACDLSANLFNCSLGFQFSAAMSCRYCHLHQSLDCVNFSPPQRTYSADTIRLCGFNMIREARESAHSKLQGERRIWQGSEDPFKYD